MRMSIFFTTCMFVLGLWLAFAASATFAEISEERAIEIANGFCQRIGWTPSEPPYNFVYIDAEESAKELWIAESWWGGAYPGTDQAYFGWLYEVHAGEPRFTYTNAFFDSLEAGNTVAVAMSHAEDAEESLRGDGRIWGDTSTRLHTVYR